MGVVCYLRSAVDIRDPSDGTRIELISRCGLDLVGAAAWIMFVSNIMNIGY